MQYPGLVFWHGRIYLVSPRGNAALQVGQFSKPCLLKNVEGPCAPGSTLALKDDLVCGVQFTQPRRQLADRNEFGAGDPADFVLVGFANIDEYEWLFPVQLRLEFRCRDGWDIHLFLRFSVGLRNSTELIVVDEIVDCRISSANRAIGVFADLELSEPHFQRVEAD